MRIDLLAVLAAGLAASVAGAEAQAVSVEARMGAAVPTGAVAERWGTGLEYGIGAGVELTPRYALYAGYSYTFFDLDIVDDMHAVDTGYAAGLTRSFPGSGTVVPWVRSGVLMHSLEIQGGAGTEDDGGLGFEVGGGVTIPSRYRRAFRASLGVGYRRYGARVLGPDRETVSYFTAAFGVAAVFRPRRNTEAQR